MAVHRSEGQDVEPSLELLANRFGSGSMLSTSAVLSAGPYDRSVCQGLEECIASILIELDVELRRHLVGQVEQLPTA